MGNPFQATADVISHASEFVHDDQFLFFASVSRAWRGAWRGRPTSTRAITPDTSPSQLRHSVDCGLSPGGTAVCTAIASVGRLDLLRAARALGFRWDKMTCWKAAEGGHLDVLRYARVNGCGWNVLTCAGAAKGGHLEVLAWARQNGCGWDEWTCTAATKEG
ncbi:unnamed protein product, partial [Ectocarpus sp. 8 AP-2014]